MPRYAVSYISFVDNELTTVIVEAADWFSAIKQHPAMQGADSADFAEWISEMQPRDTENIKQSFFDCDSMIDWIEIPD